MSSLEEVNSSLDLSNVIYCLSSHYHVMSLCNSLYNGDKSDDFLVRTWRSKRLSQGKPLTA